ncbi:GNAT family N-acetyltransferase [Parasedimentitalea maritima]|uniref:GNAT family N-acetyltransferase n=1 Tax=Parasedimentitalea maritima TaxID=2578117 RepID=A0ABY2V1K1_9RHOB|nr:N-acetyltransferase [Zongyanglinia marina]TLP69242.1 GNAT family N-acetyltransferase [Zongyanglinia marina]
MPALPATLSIRPARPSDCSSLAALSIEVWLGTYIREGVNAFFADYVLAHYTVEQFAKTLKDPAERVLVSENSIGIDGYIRITNDQPCPADHPSTTEVTTLYVQPRHHGKGIGQELLRAGLDLCREIEWDTPWLATNSENTNALSFYKRQGFTIVGQTHFEIEDQRYCNEVFAVCA